MISASIRPVFLGSEGFYAFARLAMGAILYATVSLMLGAPVWPTFDLDQALVTLVSVYAIFTVAIIPTLYLRLKVISRVAMIIDVIVLSLLTLLSPGQYDLFYPLFIIPLVGAALQFSQTGGLSIGVLGAFGYGTARILSHPDLLGNPIAVVSLILHCIMMILIPILASGLAERWSSANRRSVEVAEQKRVHALGEALAYRDRTRALYQVAARLSANSSNQAILDTTLAEGRKLAPYKYGVALLADSKPDQLFVAAGHQISLNEQNQIIRLGVGPISTALRDGEPFLIDDMQVEPVFAPLTGLMHSASACVIPLRAGLHTYGALVVGAERRNAFNEEHVDMLAALAQYALVALQNAQLVTDLRSERTKLLSKEEEVRHQLARDLHDGPAQALAAITMNVEFIKRLLERDPPRVVPELDKLGKLARHTTHEVRTMLFELRPLALETQGLATTLQQYVERFQGSATQIIIEADDTLEELDTRTEGTLFNIIQEAINNAMKHAKAQHIWVRLKQLPGLLEATIQDDGAGFNLEQTRESYEKRGSFGLLNIDERAQLIGGKAELRSAPGMGTTVRVMVPTPP